MKAMMLTAGEGTRLRPLTETRPKPILPLAGRPLLDYTFDLLALHGVEEVVLNLHHAADALAAALEARPHPRMRTSVSYEPTLLGTAGAVRRVADRFDATFLLLYGDNLADIDLGDLVAFHRDRCALATIGLFTPRDPTAVGIVRADPSGWVTGFEEKPSHPTPPFAANAGVYVLEPEVLDRIPDDRPSDWGRDIFPTLIRDGAHVAARFLQGHLRDTGTPEGYLRAHRDLLGGRLPRLWRPATHGFEALRDAVWVHASAQVDRPERLREGTLIGPRSHVADDARIGRAAVIGADVQVERGTRVVGSVLWEESRLDRDVIVDRAIVGARCRLESGSKVLQGAMVGDDCVIRAGAVVAPGTRVPPGVTWS
jgi:NDP-sugar pyrophosphorylase family protein